MKAVTHVTGEVRVYMYCKRDVCTGLRVRYVTRSGDARRLSHWTYGGGLYGQLGRQRVHRVHEHSLVVQVFVHLHTRANRTGKELPPDRPPWTRFPDACAVGIDT